MAEPKVLTLRLPPAIHKKVKSEAFRRNMSMNAVVIEALQGRDTERKLDAIIKHLTSD